MRSVSCAAMILAFAGGVFADDKIDPAKLVGKWEKVQASGEKMIMEFTKDGKLKVTASLGGETFTIDGTYKVEGNKLTTTIMLGSKGKEEVSTIDKLTDDEFTSSDDKKKSITLKRLKEK